MGFSNIKEKLDVEVPNGPQEKILCVKNIHIWQQRELEAYKNGIFISSFLPERREKLTKVQWWQRAIEENPGMAAEDIDKLAETTWQSTQQDPMTWDMCAEAIYISSFRGEYSQKFEDALKAEYKRIMDSINTRRKK